MGKHSGYAGSSASRSTQNFLEGNWEIIFKALRVYREAVDGRKHWNALTCLLIRDWLSYGVSMKWNTMLPRKNDVPLIQKDLQDICLSLNEKKPRCRTVCVVFCLL